MVPSDRFTKNYNAIPPTLLDDFKPPSHKESAKAVNMTIHRGERRAVTCEVHKQRRLIMQGLGNDVATKTEMEKVGVEAPYWTVSPLLTSRPGAAPLQASSRSSVTITSASSSIRSRTSAPFEPVAARCKVVLSSNLAFDEIRLGWHGMHQTSREFVSTVKHRAFQVFIVVSYSDGHGLELDVGRCEVDAVDSALTRIWLLQEGCSSLHTTESTLAIGLGKVQ